MSRNNVGPSVSNMTIDKMSVVSSSKIDVLSSREHASLYDRQASLSCKIVIYINLVAVRLMFETTAEQHMPHREV